MQADKFQRLQQLFDAALELPSDARHAFIAQSCGDDQGLADAVIALLAQEEKSQQANTLKPLQVVANAMNADQAAAQVGRQLGRYRLLEEIGAGGMGRVFRAERVDGEVSQTVAIKRLRFPEHEPEFARRFARERQILASLTHPHIARFLDAGTDDTGQPYVVIEYIDGLAMVEYANKHRLTLQARIRMLLKVMDAVAYSHRQLILHRDIKSNNVLVDAKGEPHLLDFGVAKPIQAISEQVGAEHDTAADQRAFSLGHAAPEQLRGVEMGTGCDVYGLGVLAYELISDAPPLQLAGLSYAEAERIVLYQFPPTPSATSARADRAPDGSDAQSWSRSLRGDLDNIVLHALKKDADERYATVDAFAQDLQRFLDKEPISLRSHQQVYRLKQFVRRNRWVVALSASLVIALACSSIVLWLQNREVKAQRDIAIEQSKRAEALSGLLIGAFEAADPSRNQGNNVSAREILDQAARRVQDNELDPATRAALLVSLADVYRTLGANQESAETARAAIDTPDVDSSLLKAKAWRITANAQFLGDDLAAANAAAKTSESFHAQLNPEQPDEQVEPFELQLVLFQIQLREGKASIVLDALKALHARAQTELGPTHAMAIRVGTDYAVLLEKLNFLEESGTLVETLLRSIAQPDRDPVGVKLLRAKATFQRESGQIDLAAVSAQRYLKAVQKLYGERHGAYVAALDLKASIEEMQGNYAEAVETMKAVLAVVDDISGERDTHLHALMLNNLAGDQNQIGQHDEAERNAAKALEIAIKRLPPTSMNISAFRNTLASTKIALGKYEQALVLLQQSEDFYATQDNPSSPGIFRASGQVSRAEALHGLGRHQEAEAAWAVGWEKLK